MEGYSVSITYTSKELTPKEKVKLKDTSNATSLDEATQKGAVTITPDYYVELDVHNEKSDSKDYCKLVIVAKDGTKYITGSQSFRDAFLDIFKEMLECDEDYEITCHRLESKNYKGKEFITCSLV